MLIQYLNVMVIPEPKSLALDRAHLRRVVIIHQVMAYPSMRVVIHLKIVLENQTKIAER